MDNHSDLGRRFYFCNLQKNKQIIENLKSILSVKPYQLQNGIAHHFLAFARKLR